MPLKNTFTQFRAFTMTEKELLFLTNITPSLVFCLALIFLFILMKAYIIICYIPLRGYIFGMPSKIYKLYKSNTPLPDFVNISYKSARKYALNFHSREIIDNGIQCVVFMIKINKVDYMINVYDMPDGRVMLRVLPAQFFLQHSVSKI